MVLFGCVIVRVIYLLESAFIKNWLWLEARINPKNSLGVSRWILILKVKKWKTSIRMMINLHKFITLPIYTLMYFNTSLKYLMIVEKNNTNQFYFYTKINSKHLYLNAFSFLATKKHMRIGRKITLIIIFFFLLNREKKVFSIASFFCKYLTFTRVHSRFFRQ